jgi:membrane-associated phospholipid phosphatase
MNKAFQDILKKRLGKKVFTGLPLTILVIVFLILLATLLGITDSIVNSRVMVQVDSTFANFLFHLRTPFMAKSFYAITYLGNVFIVTIPFLAGLIYLYFKKEFAYLYALFLAFIGTEGSVYLIKIFIHRDRPGGDIAYYLENSKSFPSFHASIAMVFYGFVVYYLIHHITGRRNKSWIIVLGAVIIGLIGFSRLYLGVHYLSDVLGGFLIGGLWLTAGITFRERHFYISSLKKGEAAS